MVELLTSEYAILGDITGLCVLAMLQIFLFGMARFWSLWATALISVCMGFGLSCVFGYCCSDLTVRSADGFLVFASLHLLDATAAVAMASLFVAGNAIQNKEDEPFY